MGPRSRRFRRRISAFYLLALVSHVSFGQLGGVIEPSVVTVKRLAGDSSRTALTIVVRSVQWPDRPVLQAQVALSAPGAPPDSSRPFRLTDSTGIVRVTEFPPGQFDVSVRALGWFGARVRLPFVTDCLSTLEVYLPVASCNLEGCPTEPHPRAVYTTCRK